jgi:hypothetical protein
LEGTFSTSGNLTEILQQCHDSHPAIWLAKKPPAWLPKPNYVVFIPSTRVYEQEASKMDIRMETFKEIDTGVEHYLSTVSSTMARRLFFCHESREEFKDCLRSLVINPELLARFLGMGNS